MVEKMIKKLLSHFQYKKHRKQGQTAVKTLRKGSFWKQNRCGNSLDGRE